MMNKKISHFILLLSSLFLASAVSATPIYDCGGGRFTDKPAKGCKRKNYGSTLSVIHTGSGPIAYNNSSSPSAGSTKKPTKTNRPATSQNVSGKYPVESPTENAGRNNGRLSILMAEKTTEEGALRKAQAALNSAKTAADKRSLQNAVVDHKKNIEAIDKEIARAK